MSTRLAARIARLAGLRPAALHMKWHRRRDNAVVALLALAVVQYAAPQALAQSQFTQQGPKLVGSGAVNGASGVLQGRSVEISADGSTAIVGGYGDNSSVGAVWIYTRGNGGWIQQGPKLVGTGAADGPPYGGSQQGYSVALSADGNTAIVGGPTDNSGTGGCCGGAVWIFTRSNGVWAQQGNKLVASDAVNGSSGALQGTAVALSADGNTAIVGGYADNSFVGASWVFTRSNGMWTQQGSKLVGTATVGNAGQGCSVALSADGNTAMVGALNDWVWVFTRSNGVWAQQGNKLIGTAGGGAGIFGPDSVALSADGDTAIVGRSTDNSGVGATWVFSRSNGVWTQQGNKLVGTGGVGPSGQGSVAVSADGNTAVVGGGGDNSDVGAVWVFGRSNGVWTQQGDKLVGTGAAGSAAQGASVALSANGKILLEGGPLDNAESGAAWVFLAPTITNSHDFNGDGTSDIAWFNNGTAAIWLMNGGSVLSVGIPGSASAGWSIVGQRDFDGDGKADLLWYNGGNVAAWFMNGTAVSSVASYGNVGSAWTVAGTGDFNGDGKGDILWTDTSGNVAMWLMNGKSVSSATVLGNVGSTWKVAGVSDFNGDGKADVLWRDTAGNVAIWLMNGTSVSSVTVLGNVPTNWSIVGTGDFDGDGHADILWRDTAGDLAIWFMNGAGIKAVASLGNVSPTWSVTQTGDYNGDGKSDILWTDTSGNVAAWLMNGSSVSSVVSFGNVPTAWQIQGANAD